MSAEIRISEPGDIARAFRQIRFTLFSPSDPVEATNVGLPAPDGDSYNHRLFAGQAIIGKTPEQIIAESVKR